MRLGQGRDNVKELLRSKPEMMEEIKEKLTAAMKPDDFTVDKTGVAARKAAAAEAAETGAKAETAKSKPISRAAARAKLDIIVDEDD